MLSPHANNSLERSFLRRVRDGTVVPFERGPDRRCPLADESGPPASSDASRAFPSQPNLTPYVPPRRMWLVDCCVDEKGRRRLGHIIVMERGKVVLRSWMFVLLDERLLMLG